MKSIHLRPLAATLIMLGGCVALRPQAPFPIDRPAAIDSGQRWIAVVGDLQITSWLARAVMRRESNATAQRVLIGDLESHLDGIAAIALVGDLVFNARSRSDWAHFDALMTPAATRVPLLPALGNHDYYCYFVQLCTQRVVPKNVRLRFPWLAPGQPYWVAFDDELALVFLDGETAIAAQGRWLMDQLAELERRFGAAVVFVHRPPYTDNITRGIEPALDIRQQLAAAFSRSSLVWLVVSGHAHGYEHLLADGVHHIVSAGGGGPRGWLRNDRPLDVYAGRDCRSDASGQVQRPFNYLLLAVVSGALRVQVRGFCKNDARVELIESFDIPLPRATTRRSSGPPGRIQGAGSRP